MSAEAEPIAVDVVSDVVCPWCYLGKKRLETALVADPAPVVVRWRPYQLDPTLPPGGMERGAYMARKFGDKAQLKAIHDRLVALGAEVGIAFAFERIKRSPNTLDAHRLVRWAHAAGAEEAVVERLFAAYFVDGLDIGDRDLLTAIASECGMDGALVGRRLEEEADADAVRSEIAYVQSLGVGGVPFFIFAGRLAVSGAQEAAVLRGALAQARQAVAGAA